MGPLRLVDRRRQSIEARALVTRARALAALERHGDAEGAADAGASPDAPRIRGRSRLTAGLHVPARACAHARHPGADVRKRFEVDAEARGELEPRRARAAGDRAGAGAV